MYILEECDTSLANERDVEISTSITYLWTRKTRMHLACQAHFILSEGGTKPSRGVHYWIAYMNDLSSKALLSNCTELVV